MEELLQESVVLAEDLVLDQEYLEYLEPLVDLQEEASSVEEECCLDDCCEMSCC